MRGLILFLLISIYLPCIGQVRIDSLLHVWNDNQQSDSLRYAAIERIALTYLYNHPDSTFYYAQLEYEFAKKANHKKAMLVSLNFMGNVFNLKSEFARALEYYQRSLQIGREINNEAWVAISLNNIGIIYQIQGNHIEAINFYNQALKINEDINNDKSTAQNLANIGNLYHDQEDYVKAGEYYSRAMELFKKVDNIVMLGKVLLNLGIVEFETGNYTKSLEYYQKALVVVKESNDKQGESGVLNGLGQLYNKMGNYTKAIKNLDESLKIQDEIGDKVIIVNSLNERSEVYENMGDHDQAIFYGKRALSIASQIKNMMEISESTFILYRNYKSKGDLKSALKMYELHIQTKDSLQSEENQKELIKQEYKYAYEKKAAMDSLAYLKREYQRDEKERIMADKSERNQLYIIFGGIILLIITTGVYHRGRVLKRINDEFHEKNLKISLQNDKLEKALTELKEAHEYLIRSEKMASLGVLSAGIAHEIINPINYVNAASNSLSKNVEALLRLQAQYEKLMASGDLVKLKKQIRDMKGEMNYSSVITDMSSMFETVQNGIDRTVEIIEGLGNYSRYDHDEPIPVDIHECLDSSLVLMKHELNNGLVVEKDYDDLVEPIHCHPGQLQQVFINLLTNAVHATNGDGKITITTKKLNQHVEIGIKDNGHGISEEVKSKIFDPFFTTKDVGKGTGLGLYICHKIIENHKGSIELNSPPVGEAGEEGRGSEFLIRLQA